MVDRQVKIYQCVTFIVVINVFHMFYLRTSKNLSVGVFDYMLSVIDFLLVWCMFMVFVVIFLLEFNYFFYVYVVFVEVERVLKSLVNFLGIYGVLLSLWKQGFDWSCPNLQQTQIFCHHGSSSSVAALCRMSEYFEYNSLYRIQIKVIQSATES